MPLRRRVLFIDCESHKATGSSNFFAELLRRRFDVDHVFVRNKYSPKMPKRARLAEYDCVVCWQVIPSNMRALSYGKPLIYVPMFDGETGNIAKWMRSRLQGVRTISFCRAESAILKKAGLDPLDVAYYPPVGGRIEGDHKKVFFWERDGIRADDVRRMFPQGSGFEVVVRNAAAKEGEDARRSYLEAMSECGVFIAPRRLEGIGLGFLEAMAIGKCVIANDAPTMNEYITNGKNGMLFKFEDVKSGEPRLSPKDLASIQDAAYNSCVKGRRRWELIDEPMILDFIERTIAEHREMNVVEAIEWLLLLPLHFIWDLKTLAEVAWRRVR